MTRHSIYLPVAKPRATIVVSADSRQTRTGMVTRSRNGLTLLEILLAAAILTAGLAALSQQNANAVKAAVRSQLESEAALRCQSIMNRLAAEGIPSTEVSEQPIDGDPEWTWSFSRIPSRFDGLSVLTVSVHRSGDNRNISSFQLSRLILNNARETER